jgi:endonuclease YncB( thermonuclease family)
VYIGGYDNSYATQEPSPQQPNLTVVYPPRQQATPVMIQVGPDGEYTTMVQRQPATIYEAPQRRETAEESEPATGSTRYLLAFKDHTIYSAVAYWADGDTLHYFTTGNTHNQASISLIDRELTERLNRELGIDFKLPAAK